MLFQDYTDFIIDDMIDFIQPVSIIGFVISKTPFTPMTLIVQIYHDVVVFYSWHIL